MNENTHKVSREYGGSGPMGWIRPICSCGWRGIQHYAYNDYQHTNAHEEADRHLAAAARAAITKATQGA